jgi:RNA polymerase sigma-70 factor (ECF subfamily)
MIAFNKWPNRLSSGNEQPIDSEAQWLKLAQGGDRVAFQNLLELHYDTIYQVAYRYKGHSEDAEDIAQEVCLGLAAKIRTFRGEAKFKTWLYTIIVNACLDCQRKRARQHEQLSTYQEFAEFDRETGRDKSQQVAWLYRALAQLPEPFKETAFLVLAEDLSHAEVGKILGCAEATVSWRMHEVRKQLKALMEDSHEG